METFVRDVRYAARSLKASPGLMFVLVACLGWGIGVNTTMFSVFNATVLRGAVGAGRGAAGAD
jgi:hypothetical protein